MDVFGLQIAGVVLVSQPRPQANPSQSESTVHVIVQYRPFRTVSSQIPALKLYRQSISLWHSPQTSP